MPVAGGDTVTVEVASSANPAPEEISRYRVSGDWHAVYLAYEDG